MTRYILVGGYPYKAKDGGKGMCKEAVKGFTQPVNILICLFARQREEWNKLFKDNKYFFKRNLLDVELDFTLADENNFVNQIKETNLLYFSGGDTTNLLNILKKTSGWLNGLDGKTVMGSSAGTDILSTYNYDIEFFKCSDGFGLAPVKTIVHYRTDGYTPPVGWKAAYEDLKQYKEELPILALREGEYEVIEV